MRLLLGQHSQALCPQLQEDIGVTWMEQDGMGRRLAPRTCACARWSIPRGAAEACRGLRQ